MTNTPHDLDLRDDFPASPARSAVVAVVRAYGTVQRLMATYFSQFELTAPQFQLLTIANRLRKQSPTQRRLARELYVSFPNVTMMLDRLEKSGLIVRRTNANDAREKLVELTVGGRTLLRKIWKVHQDQLGLVVKGLTEKEQKELARLLNKLSASHANPNGEDLTSESP